jgi:hypothetical protein
VKRRREPAHEPGEVTDPWSGGREVLRDMFPGSPRDWLLGRNSAPVDAHEHGHHDGALFYHEHGRGQEPHDHVYACDGEDAGGGAGCFTDNQASESSAVYQ